MISGWQGLSRTLRCKLAMRASADCAAERAAARSRASAVSASRCAASALALTSSARRWPSRARSAAAVAWDRALWTSAN